MFKRLKNLWKLSEYAPQVDTQITGHGTSMATKTEITLKRDIPYKPKPAIILQDEPLSMFEEEKEL